MKRLLGLNCIAIHILATCLRAQTVSYMDPTLESSTAHLTTPPVLRWESRPRYPEALEKAAEFGYVVIVDSVEEDGTTAVRQVLANSPAFGAEFEAGRADWRLKPGKVDGKPVHTSTYFGVIFNPRPFKRAGFDVSPRLTRVSPLRLPRKETDADSLVVPATLTLDATGKVTDAKFDAEMADGARTSLLKQITRNWEFAPATLAGKPVVSTVSIPVAVQFFTPGNKKKNFKSPTVTYQERPVYPYEMRQSGIEAQVVVDFVVSKTGSVVSAYVTRSTGPWFEQPALSAIRNWKFKPGTVDGVPVNVHLQVPIVFQLEGGLAGNAYSVSGSNHAKGEFPAEITGVVLPLYPIDLVRADKDGKAEVLIIIGTDGRPIQVKVTKADDPRFGLALSAAAWEFYFTPAYKDGKPAVSGVKFEHEFRTREVDGSVERLIDLEKYHPEKIHSGRELDAPLNPISRRPMVPPRDQSADRTVVVDFLIDEEGKAQLPRVATPNPDELDYAAMLTVSNWMFDAPTIHGKSVVVRAQVPMVFKLSPPAAAK